MNNFLPVSVHKVQTRLGLPFLFLFSLSTSSTPPPFTNFFYPSQMLMQPEGSLKLKWCENRIAVANELCLLVPSGPNEPFECAFPTMRRPCSGPWSLWYCYPLPLRQPKSSQSSRDRAEIDWNGALVHTRVPLFFFFFLQIHRRSYCIVPMNINTHEL